MNFMLFSNVFLFLPVIISAWKGEWIYFTFALGLAIFSPIYHYLTESKTKKDTFLKITKNLDWLFAIGAYAYMYYFIFERIGQYQIVLFILLSSTVLFFYYGYKFGNYKKWHPWFHVVAPIVSSFIVLLGS